MSEILVYYNYDSEPSFLQNFDLSFPVKRLNSTPFLSLNINQKSMKTIINLFESSVGKFSNNIYLWEKLKGKFEGTTYKQTYNFVYRFGAGLMALGLQKGDRVGLISEGRNAWIISEL